MDLNFNVRRHFQFCITNRRTCPEQCRKLLSFFYLMFNSLLILISTFIDVSLAIPSFGQADTLNLFQRSVVSSGCSTTGPASCHNTTVQSNLCCFEAPGVRCSSLVSWGMSLMCLLDVRVYCCKLRQVYFAESMLRNDESDPSLVLGHQSNYRAR